MRERKREGRKGALSETNPPSKILDPPLVNTNSIANNIKILYIIDLGLDICNVKEYSVPRFSIQKKVKTNGQLFEPPWLMYIVAQFMSTNEFCVHYIQLYSYMCMYTYDS